MPSPLKMLVRNVGVRFFQIIGSEIRDCRSGHRLGRGLLICWHGQVHLLGYEGHPLIPVFRSQERLTYWKQEIGFTSHPEVDFRRQRIQPDA